MPPRFFVDLPFTADACVSLPAGAARHVQVLRLQPGAPVVLFNGLGGEWQAQVRRMGRSEVEVQLGPQAPGDQAPAVGGVVDAVAPPVSGALLQPGDYSGLAQALAACLQADRPEARQARRDFAEGFAWSRFGERLRRSCVQTMARTVGQG